MYCSSCGAKNAAESNFCRQCGLKLEKTAPAHVTEEAFDRALPEDEQVTALLDRAYRRRKDNDLAGAIALCHEVLAIRPDSTTAHGVLGQLYEQSGERERAMEQYERVLALNPGSIADRVKLDDLRDGRQPGPATLGPLPKVVVVNSDGGPMRGAMAWGAGIGALLLLSGAALAIVFTRGAPRTQDDRTEQAARKYGSPDLRGAEDLERSRKIASSSAVQDRNGSGTLGSGAVQGYVQAYGLGAPIVPLPTPASQTSAPQIQYVVPQGYGPRTPAAAQANAAPPVRRSQKPAPQPERASSDADAGSERIYLTVPGATPGGDSHGAGASSGKPADPKNSGAAPGRQSTEPETRIRVTPFKGSVDSTAGSPPTSEASAMIAVGQDKLNKMDYPGAILAFRKALGGANDESAYVYLELGQCYQAHHENRNAVSMYEHARDDYKKLVAAGRQLERANESIRICETGIKICSSE